MVDDCIKITRKREDGKVEKFSKPTDVLKLENRINAKKRFERVGEVFPTADDYCEGTSAESKNDYGKLRFQHALGDHTPYVWEKVGASHSLGSKPSSEVKHSSMLKPSSEAGSIVCTITVGNVRTKKQPRRRLDSYNFDAGLDFDYTTSSKHRSLLNSRNYCRAVSRN
jgi:hypothetical protein